MRTRGMRNGVMNGQWTVAGTLLITVCSVCAVPHNQYGKKIENMEKIWTLAGTLIITVCSVCAVPTIDMRGQANHQSWRNGSIPTR